MKRGKELRRYVDAYQSAQIALANLKAAVLTILAEVAPLGLSNAEVGRTLGIYAGHVGHEGHISRALLQMLQADGVAEQDKKTKRWRFRGHAQMVEEPDPEDGG